MHTAAAHLQTVIRHWPDLRAALTQYAPQQWPPAGRLTDYLAMLDEHDRELWLAEARAERTERNADALGERPVPLRLTVLDTIRAVEAALVECADQIASAVQRPPYTARTGQGWADELHREITLLATRDAANPRRWRYTGQRTAPEAAQWLLSRVQARPGPFRPLTPTQHRHIAQVAAEAARRVQTALGMDRRSRHLPRPCPRCGHTLTLHTGGTQLPEVTCAGGCRPWTGPELASLLAQLEPAA